MNEDTRIMMIDTETANDIDCPLVYDVGYQIFSVAEGVLLQRSFVNADIFLYDELMQNAYFAEKIPQYRKDIFAKRRDMRQFRTIKRILTQDCKNFGVEIACAHNAAFDNRALNTTQRYETSSKYRYFLPYGIEWWDTLKMARAILRNNESYTSFCWENEYLTKNMRIRYTAEIIYRWLQNNPNFEESHTGLEDVEIERQIFEFLYHENPNFNGALWSK